MTSDTVVSLPEQAAKVLSQIAGYVGFQTIRIGVEHGLIEALADRSQALTPQELAEAVETDPFYTEVWSRAAVAAGVLEAMSGERVQLAPHMATVILDSFSPAYVGGLFKVMALPEMFEHFSDALPSGKQVWWNELSPEFIHGVAGTSRPFYTRLLGAGISQVPGLQEALERGVRVVEFACGTGDGMLRLAERFPNSSFVGVDGDPASLEQASGATEDAGLRDRVSLVQSTLETFDHEAQYDVALINVSMHECRDIEEATANIRRSLRSGGIFVISDFPFPESPEGLGTVPGRILTGIQYFEARIGDQLLPTREFFELLQRHGFKNVGSFDLSPVHAITHGEAP